MKGFLFHENYLKLVEIKFFKKFQGAKILRPKHLSAGQKAGTFCWNFHLWRKNFHISHKNWSMILNSRCLVGKPAYVTNICHWKY